MSNKKDSHTKCGACDFQKLKILENNPIIRKLRDKIEQLNFRLTECKNENQMLKRNLQLAKKMVCQEVGGQDIDFQSLMKHGTESGSKGRQEDVLVLKTRVQELKDYLRELEGDPPATHETASEEYVRHQMPQDKKKLWRMELERRLARENAEKDISPLVQECLELRRSLDTEKCRFRELSEEVKLLKAELQSQVEKNEEDFGIIKSFETLETQLEETLKERAEIRQELEGARTRNKRLIEEITSLNDELQVLQKKTNDSNVLIDSLTSSHKSIQEAIESEKVIVQQNTERYKEELKTVQDNYKADLDLLNHLQRITQERTSLIDNLEDDLNINTKSKSEKKQAVSRNVEGVECARKFKQESNKPESNKPESNKPESNKPESNKPESKKPESKKPESNKPDSKKPESNKPESKKPESNAPKDKTSNEDDADAEEEEESKKKAESELKIRKLRLECAKYKALCEAAKMEGDRLSLLIKNQDKKMNEIAVQVVETGRLIMQKNAEKKDMLEKVNRLQKSFSCKRRKGKFHAQAKSKIEEIRIKSEAQREENDFLRNFLRSAVCCKTKELEQLKGFIADSKHFYDACLNEIKELLSSEPRGTRTNLTETESVDELSN